MIGGKPPNPHFNLLFLNESCIKTVVGDSAVLPFVVAPKIIQLPYKTSQFILTQIYWNVVEFFRQKLKMVACSTCGA